ncbi:Succinate dehydrogenase assembly factor 2 mitochondrial [Diatrype stigma]|uniref:Succinate dehydrogenase assembly factor 2, mitochondrial n=1 Tax=Diatrype stigma TaxID=117547 RepID=A0AAN9YSX0_9PEZI
MASAARLMRPARLTAAAAARSLSSRNATVATFICRPLSTTPAAQRVVPPDGPNAATAGEMGVGELEGAKFRVEPVRRVGEDDKTMRARLIYQSRKRGTLESDLLLSTFADAHLPSMSRAQMAELDRFLDENDWDIYYWATQDPPSATASSASSTPFTPATTSDPDYGSGAEAAIASSSSAPAATNNNTATAATAAAAEALEAEADTGAGEAAAAAAAAAEPYSNSGSGEWAQTVGTFKPAYRPVPARWRDSEVLRLLREHVRRQAGKTGGMAFMPALR